MEMAFKCFSAAWFVDALIPVRSAPSLYFSSSFFPCSSYRLVPFTSIICLCTHLVPVRLQACFGGTLGANEE